MNCYYHSVNGIVSDQREKELVALVNCSITGFNHNIIFFRNQVCFGV